MNFGAALKELTIGIRVTRKAWSDLGTSVVLSDTGISIVQVSMDGYRSHWHVRHDDLLAEDWEIVVPKVGK